MKKSHGSSSPRPFSDLCPFPHPLPLPSLLPTHFFPSKLRAQSTPDLSPAEGSLPGPPEACVLRFWGLHTDRKHICLSACSCFKGSGLPSTLPEEVGGEAGEGGRKNTVVSPPGGT